MSEKKMSVKEAKAYVVAAIADCAEGVAPDKQQLAIDLLQKGVGMSTVQNVMRACFKEAGLSTSTSATSLKAVREAVAADARTAGIDTYKEMREWAEELSDEHDVTFESALKVIKEVLKDEKREIPTRINLGSVKTSIVEYFNGENASDPKFTPSIDDLAKYIQENHPDMDEKLALRTSRMNFAFAKIMRDRETVDALN